MPCAYEDRPPLRLQEQGCRLGVRIDGFGGNGYVQLKVAFSPSPDLTSLSHSSFGRTLALVFAPSCRTHTYISTHTYIYIYISIYLSVYLSIYLSIYLTIFLSILSYPILSYPILSNPIQSYPILSNPIQSYPSIYLSIYLSTYLSIYLSISLSLSLCLSLWPFLSVLSLLSSFASLLYA